MNRVPRQILFFHAAAFLSAFLLFLIQPAMAKALLPGFGGSFVVWGACMAFFQALLIAGYAWAHGVQRRFGVGRYAPWHLLVMLAPLVFMRADYHAVARQGAPLFLEVVRLLSLAVGVPFLALATNSLILQRWLAFSDLPQRDNPYVLYAASNAGSILALLAYPTLVEPLLTLDQQWRLWWGLYVALIAVIALCLPALRVPKPDAGVAAAWADDARSDERGLHPSARQLALWLTLSMAGCAMLLAVTNMITFDVASIPLFWTLPLAVYLATFVLLFKRRPWNPLWMQRAFGWAVPAAVVVYLLMQLRLTFPLALQIGMQLSFLFVVCMRVHGWLAQDRPVDVRLLTAYFLAISVGGFLGSFLVSWIVPMTFSTLIEFPLALLLAAAGGMLHRSQSAEEIPATSDRLTQPGTLACAATTAIALLLLPWMGHRFSLPGEVVAAAIALPLTLALRAGADRPARTMLSLAVFAAAVPWTSSLAEGEHATFRLRNFYGIYKVFDEGGIRYLQHGSTTHGREYLDAARAGTPLSYFHPSTPAAGLLRMNPLECKNIAMIGLGAGSLAAYLHAGQHFTIYELDPDNLPIAENDFSYLKIGREHGAKIDFVFGDGRINLRNVPDGTYDLLIIDAFSSDAIPVHLLTVEALREYFRTLKPDGLLMLHVSNKFVELEPLVASLAQALGYAAAGKNNMGEVAPDADLTFWAAVARDPKTLQPMIQKLGWRRMSTASFGSVPRAWTDQYSNLLGLLFMK